jgi:type IV pilus assembly protein PilV
MDPLPEDQHGGYVDHDTIFDGNHTGLARTVHMKSLHKTSPQRGFTLIEVMVAVIVLSAGLLGVAKMQALALSSTNIANVRSIAAIEAASLAATMHENRAYWASAAPASNPNNGTISITSTGPTAIPTITANGNLTAAVDCTSASLNAQPYCNAIQMAAFDLQQWALAMNLAMPNYTANIQCNAFSPVNCTIQITWTERVVALNNQEATAQANAVTNGQSSLQAPTYTLFVEP